MSWNSSQLRTWALKYLFSRNFRPLLKSKVKNTQIYMRLCQNLLVWKVTPMTWRLLAVTVLGQSGRQQRPLAASAWAIWGPPNTPDPDPTAYQLFMEILFCFTEILRGPALKFGTLKLIGKLKLFFLVKFGKYLCINFMIYKFQKVQAIYLIPDVLWLTTNYLLLPTKWTCR